LDQLFFGTEMTDPEKSKRVTLMTDLTLKGFCKRPPEKQTDVADPACPGLSARITPTGRITWSLRLRVTGEGGRSERGHRPKGQQYRLTLGAYPSIGIKQARALASDYVRQAEAGAHPVRALERKAKARHETLELLAQSFIDDFARPNLRSWPNAQSAFRRHLVPAWGRLPVDSIDERDAARLINEIAKGYPDPETNKLVPLPGAAAEVRKWGRRLFSWAIQNGLAHENPFEQTKTPVRLKPRQRFLDIHEARAVWKAASERDYPWRELIQMLMLTGCRLREIGHARWSWINLPEMRISIPADAYKTGRPYLVALPEAAIEVLKSLPRWNEGIFLFSTSGGIQPIWGIPRKVVNELHENAEHILKRKIEHFVIHDLRRTVRTHLS